MRPVDIAPGDLETVRLILRKHVPDFEVRAFGSRVSWTARDTSDLDLAIISDKPLDITALAEIKEDFRQSNLPFRVDVVDWSTVSDGFREIIESNSEILRPECDNEASIAKTCASLKRKVELNRQMNGTLETILRTAVKDWFIDYGPVRAKSNDGSAYLPKRLWSLFPDRLVNSEIGKIPEEWRLKSIATVAGCVNGIVDLGEIDEGTPYIELQHMPCNSIFISEWKSAGESTGVKLKIKVGDFLFGNPEPGFRRFGVTPVDGTCSADLTIVRPRTRNFRAMILIVFLAQKLIDIADMEVTMAKNPRAIWESFAQRKIAVPPPFLVAECRKFAQTISDLIVANAKELHLLDEILRIWSFEIRP